MTRTYRDTFPTALGNGLMLPEDVVSRRSGDVVTRCATPLGSSSLGMASERVSRNRFPEGWRPYRFGMSDPRLRPVVQDC